MTLGSLIVWVTVSWASPCGITPVTGWPVDAETGCPVDRWGQPQVGLDARSPMRDVCIEDGHCAWARASDVLALTSIAMGLATMTAFTIETPNGQRPRAGVGYAISMATSLIAQETTKRTALRPRPLTYDPDYAPRQFNRDHRFSFYSGHTSITATHLFYAATELTLWSTVEPQFGVGAALYTAALAGTVTVAILRVRAGKHFWTDVMTGGLLGAAFGIAGPVIAGQVFPRSETATLHSETQRSSRHTPTLQVLWGRF